MSVRTERLFTTAEADDKIYRAGEHDRSEEVGRQSVRRAVARMAGRWMSVSETWKVIPMVNAR
jgi:hypothetical protein